jgi:preprotein translocase subunit YajC
MIDIAYAMAPPQQGGGGETSVLMGFLPMILIFAVFYFLLIRPQQKKATEHRKMLDNLKRGDGVITQGGLFGKVVAIQDQVVTLEIADKVKVRVAKPQIAGLDTPGTIEDQASR